jgi:uncharacterized protein (DUF2235 family)
VPKKIVVFADGTGNSSAKLFRTNVWRLYQALDTGLPASPGQWVQIAYYHNGVGTSSFQPLAFFGGAFGWGLKRSVLDCYKFICRNYEPGDRIYLFGFSRGAFAVRVLAGLVCNQGIVQPDSNADLERYARDAYREYRQNFNTTAKPSRALVHWLRGLRLRVINSRRRRQGRPIYTRAKNVQPAQAWSGTAIEFIGVWDTVAAYGMPIAEMTRAIDKYIWPLSMPNYQLDPEVAIARQALALDDERDTFHPLLWNEVKSVHPERLKQVWFAGMHSDVGGGYPDDTLSYTPLEWMMDEAAAAGLSFAPLAIADIRRWASSVGPIHDSRHGLSAYYRYQPRKLEARVDPPSDTTLLMRDPKQPAALLTTVNIHESVFQRIAMSDDGYAPIILNEAYHIVPTDKGPNPPSEPDPKQRAADQERVWDRVWWRRINYFASLAISVALATMPLWHLRAAPCTGPQCLLAPVISTAGEFLPSFAGLWINAFAASPGLTLVLVLILTSLLLLSGKLEERLRADMRALWVQSLGLPQTARVPPSPPAWIRRLRTSKQYQRGFQFLKWRFLPGLFGLTFWVVIIVPALSAIGAIVLRSVLWFSEATSGACPAAPHTQFATYMKCYSLDRHLLHGDQYRVTVDVTEPWSDGRVATTPEGFGPTSMPFPINMTASLRRSPSARWFQPLIKIVGSNWFGLIHSYRIVPLEMQLTNPAKDEYTAEFTAPIDGDAEFSVNDLGRWARFFYTYNQQGMATVTIVCLLNSGPTPCRPPQDVVKASEKSRLQVLRAPVGGTVQSLGLNIVDSRVQLASTAGFEPSSQGRRFAVDQSVQRRDLSLETGGPLANVGLEVIDGHQNRHHGAKR